MNTFSTWKKGFFKREKTHLTSGTIHCHKFCSSVIYLGEKIGVFEWYWFFLFRNIIDDDDDGEQGSINDSQDGSSDSEFSLGDEPLMEVHVSG